MCIGVVLNLEINLGRNDLTMLSLQYMNLYIPPFYSFNFSQQYGFAFIAQAMNIEIQFFLIDVLPCDLGKFTF